MVENYKIFLSYSRQDKDQVFAIKSEIEDFIRKDICWIDLKGIESDQQFADVIINAINETLVFLFFYSVNSRDSKYARKELEYASRKNKKVVFVKLDDTPLSDWFEFHYGGHDIIDINDLSTKQKLFSNLCDWCDEKKAEDIFTIEVVNKSFKKQSRNRLNIYMALIPLLIIIIGIFFLVRRPQLTIDDPYDLILTADSLCSKHTKYPLEIVDYNDNPKIYNLYLKGAKGCDEKANKAIELYNTCVSYDLISDAQCYSHNAGYAWERIGEYDKSIDSYKNAITYGKMIARTFEMDDDIKTSIINISYSMNNLAFSYFENNDTTMALSTIDEAIIYNTSALNYHDSKGELLYLCGKYEEALEQWNYIKDIEKYYVPNYWVDSCMAHLKRNY